MQGGFLFQERNIRECLRDFVLTKLCSCGTKAKQSPSKNSMHSSPQTSKSYPWTQHHLFRGCFQGLTVCQFLHMWHLPKSCLNSRIAELEPGVDKSVMRAASFLGWSWTPMYSAARDHAYSSTVLCGQLGLDPSYCCKHPTSFLLTCHFTTWPNGPVPEHAISE